MRAPLPPLALAALALLAGAARARPSGVPLPADLRVIEVAVPGGAAGSAGAFAVPLEVDGAPRTLVLAPGALVAEGFRARVQGADGRIRERALPVPRTVRGALLGVHGSAAAGVVGAQGLSAVVRLPGGRGLAIEPLARWLAGGAPTDHVLYATDDLRGGSDARCGSPAGPSAAPLPAPPPSTPPGCTAVAQIAFDVDVELYQALGSSEPAVLAEVLLHLAAVDLIYRTDVGIAYQLTDVLIRTAEPDPYTTTDASDLLFQLRNAWSGSYPDVPRDVVHLLTGRDLVEWFNAGVVGYAETGTVCGASGSGASYAVSELFFPGATLPERVGLVAHELGHNWSAVHCDFGALCFTDDCQIMCSSLSFAPTLASFAPDTAAAIASFRDTRACFNDALFVDAAAVAPFAGSPLAPFASVADALGCAADGAVVELAPGTYAEGGLSLSEPVTLTAPDGPATLE